MLRRPRLHAEQHCHSTARPSATTVTAAITTQDVRSADRRDIRPTTPRSISQPWIRSPARPLPVVGHGVSPRCVAEPLCSALSLGRFACRAARFGTSSAHRASRRVDSERPARLTQSWPRADPDSPQPGASGVTQPPPAAAQKWRGFEAEVTSMRGWSDGDSTQKWRRCDAEVTRLRGRSDEVARQPQCPGAERCL